MTEKRRQIGIAGVDSIPQGHARRVRQIGTGQRGLTRPRRTMNPDEQVLAELLVQECE
jgi:hypothetical protein